MRSIQSETFARALQRLRRERTLLPETEAPPEPPDESAAPAPDHEVEEGHTVPTTGWEDVAGYPCCQCGGPATHIYGNVYLCCSCHARDGGGLWTREEAEREHARVLNRRAEEGGE